MLILNPPETTGHVLRIDKGSRAASHVFRYSIGTINSTVTIHIPYER